MWDWNIIAWVLVVIIVTSIMVSLFLRGAAMQDGEFGLPKVEDVTPMPEVKPPKQHGTVVPSVWHHMQCGHCHRFFAVEDAPAGRNKWYCPWCGDSQEMREAA